MIHDGQIEIGFPKEPETNNEWSDSKKKNKEQLEQQLKSVEGILNGAKTETESDVLINLAPRSENGNIFNLSLKEIKDKYPERYAIYLKILRAERNKQSIDETELEKMKDWIEVLNNLDNYIIDCSDEKKRILREYQVNVFEALRDFIEDGGKRGYIKLPTGVGKTVLFIEFIKAFNDRIMIVVPTQQLVQQTEDRIRQFAPDLETGLVYSDRKEYEKKVTITTYDSLVAGIKSGKLNPNDYQVLVLDEAHKSSSAERQTVVGKFKYNIIVGFTATPRYSEGKHVGKFLETEIYRLSVKEATEQGLLAPFSCVTVKTDVDLSNIDLKNDGEYDIQELERIINIKSRNKAAVELYQNPAYKDKSALVFCLTIKHAEDVAKEFVDQGISAAVITGWQTRKDQEKIIDKFKNGKLKVILTVDLLAEGFDAQNATVCFNLAPTHSLVRAEQRAGRVLRKNKNDPNKHAYVVDFLDKETREDNQPVLFSGVVEGFALDPEDNFRTYVNISKTVRKRPKEEQPEQLDFDLADVKVIKSVENVLEIKEKPLSEREKLKSAPEGWNNINQLSEEFKISHNQIKRIILEIIKTVPSGKYPKFFGYYLGWKFHYGTIYYSPEFIKMIVKLIAPDGWKTADQIIEELKKEFKVRPLFLKQDIMNLENNIRREQDILGDIGFGNYFGSKDKHARAYYSPEFIELIRSRFSNDPQANLEFFRFLERTFHND